MPTLELPEEFILDIFQASLIGRLTRGIVHNINGPIQILSMQLELLKREIEKERTARQDPCGVLAQAGSHAATDATQGQTGKQLDRVCQMQEVLGRIEEMVSIIGRRSDEGGDGPRHLLISQILEGELEFLKGDLFYKHQIETRLELPPNPPLVVAYEGLLKDLIAAVLSACIEQMRNAGKRILGVGLLHHGDAGCWGIHFSQTGNPFNAGKTAVPEMHPPEEGPISGAADPVFLALALHVARVRAAQLGGTFTVEPHRISYLFQGQP